MHGGTLLLAPAVNVDAWLPASSFSQSYVSVCHQTMALRQCHSLTTMCIAQPTAAGLLMPHIVCWGLHRPGPLGLDPATCSRNPLRCSFLAKQML